MLSSTRNIYNQTFARPGNILLKKDLELQSEYFEEGLKTDLDMLLIHPRKRSRATFDNDHATSHPASWQESVQRTVPNAQTPSNTGPDPDLPITYANSTPFSKTEVASLSLEQLQELSVLVSDRILIKKRFNITPLRRILARQALSSGFQTPSRPDSDTASQTDTLVNAEMPETVKESPETRRARYNNTPLRRILSRQTAAGSRDQKSPETLAHAQYEREPLEVRKARYNNTPLRRIVSHQTSSTLAGAQPTAPPKTPQQLPPAPVPRSNTPLRRILSRQTSAQTVSAKENDDDSSERADSVIDPDSPIRSRTAAPSTSLVLNDEERIRAHESALWTWSTNSLASSASSLNLSDRAGMLVNDEASIRAFEEILWAKTAPSPPAVQVGKEKETETTVTITELGDAKKPKRIVVDSKGSPLRRILQRQSSADWRAPARVGVV